MVLSQALRPATKVELRPAPTVNDFSIQVATVNGSGSMTSNNILMRTIFQMGVPVSGKNLFPSNIQGLPTWFTIRASKDGHVARRRENEVLVCMNPETAVEDVQGLAPHRVCVYDAPLRLSKLRQDTQFFEIPFAQIVAGIPDTDMRIRKLLANMCYVGVLAEILGLDHAEIESALQRQFKGKAKAVGINLEAIKRGAGYVKEHFSDRESRYRIERMNATAGKIIIDGNAAAAMGALMAGCSVVAWYPITPSSSLVESFIDLARKYRHDPQTGQATYAVVQAEDELASLGIVLGASWAGARAMTSTSGPGISLMAEFAGLGYYAEVPAVIFDVQRVGPSTGLPTRTQQADLLEVAFLSHGDTRHIVLLPGSVEECYTLAQEAFDLAERFQTPVFVLSDLDLGMNNWMADPFPYPSRPLDRGKVLSAADLERLKADGKKFERYRDVDGDGIPFRTLPGTLADGASYFTRGSGHNEKAQYTEDHAAYVRVLDRLAKKYATAREWVPKPLLTSRPDADIGVLAFGSSDPGVREALEQLAAKGISTSYLRLRAIPFHPLVQEFVGRHKRVYVVEQNRDAQMLALLKIDLPPELTLRLRSILHYCGLPLDAKTVTDGVLAGEGLEQAPLEAARAGRSERRED